MLLAVLMMLLTGRHWSNWVAVGFSYPLVSFYSFVYHFGGIVEDCLGYVDAIGQQLLMEDGYWPYLSVRLPIICIPLGGCVLYDFALGVDGGVLVC